MATDRTSLFLIFVLSIFSFNQCQGTGNGLFAELSPAANSRSSRVRRDTLKEAENVIPSNYSIHEPPPPDENGGPTNVEFYVLIVAVRNIQEVTEELQLELNMQIFWQDTRLSHLADRSGNKYVVLNPVLIEQIWHPDIFIDHVKKIEQPKLISTPASLRIYPDSTIRYSGRLTLTMACSFDFHFFPADTQRCAIEFKSYAYSNKILTLDWREHKPAAIKRNLELPNFKVALGNTNNFTVPTNSGQYSAISFTIVLRRLITYHLIQTYLPSVLFVFVSWLSFLVSPEWVPGRMTLCITTLLTITAMFASVRQSVPNVSYVKALDIWMISSTIFIFLTLVEFTLILKLKSIKKKPAAPPANINNSFSPNAGTSETPRKISNGNMENGFRSTDVRDKSSSTPTSPTWVHISEYGDHVVYPNGNGVRQRTVLTTPQGPPSSTGPTSPATSAAPAATGGAHDVLIDRIEILMSILIPLGFVVFNCIYWPWLIQATDYFNEEEFANTIYA